MAVTIVAAMSAEPVDALVWRTLGVGPGAVEAVLEANQGITELGALLPEGTSVIIPDLAPATTPIDIVQLWD